MITRVTLLHFRRQMKLSLIKQVECRIIRHLPARPFPSEGTVSLQGAWVHPEG